MLLAPSLFSYLTFLFRKLSAGAASAFSHSTYSKRMRDTYPMGRGWNKAGDKMKRKIIAWALLSLVVLRALIPVGFMPDIDALRDNRIEIVVCTPNGLKTLAISSDANGFTGTQDGSSEGTATHECPFDAVISQAIVLQESFSNFERPVKAADLPLPVKIGTLSVRLQGPPLGSRAPPILSL